MFGVWCLLIAEKWVLVSVKTKLKVAGRCRRGGIYNARDRHIELASYECEDARSFE